MVDQQNPQTESEQQKQLLAQQILQETQTSDEQPQTVEQRFSGFSRFVTPKKLLIIVGLILLLLVIILAITRFSNDTFTPARGDGEIVWWTVKEDVESLRPIVDKFQEQNPNIKVILKPQSEADYVSRLTNAISGDDGPEIFEIHKSWIPVFRQNLYTMPDTVGTVGEYQSDFYPVIYNDLVFDNKMQAMPLYYDAIAFYVNQDLFTRAAIVPPTTWIELQSIAANLTQRGGGNLVIQSGVSIGNAENVDYWQEIVALLMYQNGVNLFSPEGERATSVFEFYNGFAKAGVWDNRLPSSTNYFAQGNVAMYFGPTNEASNIINQNPNLRFRTELLPQVPKGSPDDPDFSYSTYYVNAVSANSGDRDSAWKLLKFLTEQEQLRQLNETREAKGLYPRIYPRISMANLQNSDPILGSVIALAYQAKGWYMNDDRIQGNDSFTDQVGALYKSTLSNPSNLDSLRTELRKLLNSYGIRVN